MKKDSKYWKDFLMVVSDYNASYGKTGQLRVSGAAIPFWTVRSTAMLARSATGEVNTVIYLYLACWFHSFPNDNIAVCQWSGQGMHLHRYVPEKGQTRILLGTENIFAHGDLLLLLSEGLHEHSTNVWTIKLCSCRSKFHRISGSSFKFPVL